MLRELGRFEKNKTEAFHLESFNEKLSYVHATYTKMEALGESEKNMIGDSYLASL